jgi:diguanylate cyclase (GGDEF)-like protein
MDSEVDPLASPTKSTVNLLRRRGWLLAVVLGTGWSLAYAFSGDSTLQSWLYSTFGLVCLGLMTLGILLHRPDRLLPWILLLAGVALLSVGDIGWFAYALGGTEAPFPSLLDAAYLGGYVAIAAGLIRMLRSDLPGGDRGGLIDALILTCGVGTLVWIFLMAPYLGDAAVDPFGTVVALAYPLMDVLLVGVVARLLFQPARRGPAFLLVLTYLFLYSVTDVVYGMQVLDGTYSGGWLDVGWIAGVFFLAAATLHPSMLQLAPLASQPEGRLTRRRLTVLAAACLLAPAAFVIQELRGQDADLEVVVGGWIALFVLVLIRLSLTVESLRTTLGQRQQLERELEFRALHDGLTGLANRHLLGERLQAALRTADGATGMLFLDLDDFKGVNDTLGHEAGDELLVAVADRIRSAVRPGDLAARLGGDEFAILLVGVSDEAAAAGAAERILDSLRRPIIVQDRDHTVWASVGVAVGSAPDVDASTLMRNADIAMYLAKARGKHQVQVYQPDLHADVVYRLGVKADLQRALDAREFVLQYQPMIRLTDGEIVGVEALVRWNHPTRGVVPPMEFIPAAESTGFIVPLGRWIMNEAIRQAVEWRRVTGCDVAMSVNVSAVQLDDPSIVDDVAAALERHGWPAASLVVEVTESANLDRDSIAATLRGLRSLGVRIAIDDFGTGFASFGCLSRLTVDYLKVDRSFVGALGTGRREATLGRAIVQLAASLGLEAVAEGIETGAQLAALQELGVPFGQGFLVDRPMSSADFSARMTAIAPVPPARQRAGPSRLVLGRVPTGPG